MKKTKVVSMLLTVVAAVVIGGCNGSGKADADMSQLQAERTWYWENELTGANDQVATENHTVVLRLQPDAAPGTPTAVKTVPHAYRKSGRYEYCIEANDPYFVGMTITDASGKTVASVSPGACVQADITAGRYKAAVTHKRLAAGASESRQCGDAFAYRGLVSANDQYRNVRVSQDLECFTTKQQSLQAMSAM